MDRFSLDVGGKLLTNYLKEILSFRHLDLKNSDRLIKQIKEDLCFVSQNLMQDMRCKRGAFLKHFILPDEELKKKGYPADIIDESTFCSMQASTPSTFPSTRNDSKYQRSYSLLKTSDSSRRASPEPLSSPSSLQTKASGTTTWRISS
jgi:actin-related protein